MMKPLAIVAWGVFLLFLLLGIGGCRFLWGLGAAAGKPHVVYDVKLPLDKK